GLHLGARVVLREAGGRVDQFLQVLDALGALALLLVVREEAAAVDHVADHLGQRQFPGFFFQFFYEGFELKGFGRRKRNGIKKRNSLLLRNVLKLLDAARADAARREIDDAQERVVVGGRGDQPQVGERVLHLGALEESQAAVDAIGNLRAEE